MTAATVVRLPRLAHSGPVVPMGVVALTGVNASETDRRSSISSPISLYLFARSFAVALKMILLKLIGALGLSV